MEHNPQFLIGTLSWYQTCLISLQTAGSRGYNMCTRFEGAVSGLINSLEKARVAHKRGNIIKEPYMCFMLMRRNLMRNLSHITNWNTRKTVSHGSWHDVIVSHGMTYHMGHGMTLCRNSRSKTSAYPNMGLGVRNNASQPLCLNKVGNWV